MKKLILLFAAALLLMPACTKESTVSPGIYSAFTYDGTLWLEIPEGGNTCFLHFEGRSESTGYYKISGNQIAISAYVGSKDGLYVLSIDEPGPISSPTKFSVPCKEPGDKNGWLSFTKRIK